LKIIVNGLEVRLEGDDTLYFVPERAYRIDRGEQVVLYSEFLPDGLAYTPEAQALLGRDKPEEKPEKAKPGEKKIIVAGLQVVDDQGVLFSDVALPDMDVFGDEPPEPKKLDLSKFELK